MSIHIIIRPTIHHINWNLIVTLLANPFLTVSTTVMIAVTVMAATSITAITQPTTMAIIQPVEHPASDPDSTGSMFIVVAF